MFDVAPSEFLIVAIVALVVIGPKDLPRVMRVVGQWVGKARGVARHFRSGFDTMVREAELEEMEARWKAENARIMSEHPPVHDAATDPAPDPALDPADAPMLPLAHPAADAPPDPAAAEPHGGRPLP